MYLKYRLGMQRKARPLILLGLIQIKRWDVVFNSWLLTQILCNDPSNYTSFYELSLTALFSRECSGISLKNICLGFLPFQRQKRCKIPDFQLSSLPAEDREEQIRVVSSLDEKGKEPTLSLSNKPRRRGRPPKAKIPALGVELKTGEAMFLCKPKVRGRPPKAKQVESLMRDRQLSTKHCINLMQNLWRKIKQVSTKDCINAQVGPTQVDIEAKLLQQEVQALFSRWKMAGETPELRSDKRKLGLLWASISINQIWSA